MLWITCPHCGHRPIDEFRFGGELPSIPAHLTDADERTVDYVWFYDNVEGVTTERWFHAAGCRRWLTLRRDTMLDTPVDDQHHAKGASE